MPTVPVIDQSTQGTPDVQAPNVSPMQNFAPQEMEKAGATMQQAGLRQMAVGQSVALRIQEQLDNANVKAGENQFIQSATDVLHGDNGYMLKRGADAINGYDQASQAIVKSKQDVLESLNNDVQKHMFDRVSQQHLVTLGAQMSAHRAQQRIEYSSTQASSRADAMRSMAQNADIGSADQNKYIETGVQEIQQALSFKGVPADSDEALKAERAYRSQITQDNVSRLMEDGKYTEAGALLTQEQQAGHVEADTGDRLRRAIRGNLQRTETIQKADEIFAPYQGKDLRGEDLEAMLAKTQKIDNPEQQQHVQELLHAKFTQTHSMQAMEYRDNLSDVVNYKAENGSLKGVDPVKWGKLSPADQADLMRPPAVQNDLNTMYGFIVNPESLTVDNVKQAYSKGLIEKGTLLSLTQRAVQLENKPEKIQEAGDINGRIDYFATAAGIPVSGAGMTPDQKNDAIGLKYKIQRDIENQKAQQGGKITGDQVDQIIKKEITQRTLKVTLPRNSWSPAKLFGSDTYTQEVKQPNYRIPDGANGVARGSDGKLHWTDGAKNGAKDLGVAE